MVLCPKKYMLLVASFTGAWIETVTASYTAGHDYVASFTGAWIETARFCCLFGYSESHPLRVRGLKHSNLSISALFMVVASFTGAWIETF